MKTLAWVLLVCACGGLAVPFFLETRRAPNATLVALYRAAHSPSGAHDKQWSTLTKDIAAFEKHTQEAQHLLPALDGTMRLLERLEGELDDAIAGKSFPTETARRQHLRTLKRDIEHRLQMAGHADVGVDEAWIRVEKQAEALRERWSRQDGAAPANGLGDRIDTALANAREKRSELATQAKNAAISDARERLLEKLARALE